MDDRPVLSADSGGGENELETAVTTGALGVGRENGSDISFVIDDMALSNLYQ